MSTTDQNPHAPDDAALILPVFIIAFAGNRPSEVEGRRAAEIEAARPALREALVQMSRIAGESRSCIHLMSGAAEGADQIVCEEAHDLGIPVHLILPLAEDLFREDFKDSPDGVWERTQALIGKAKQGVNGGSLRVAGSTRERGLCYARAADDMLNCSDALLAMTNGIGTDKSGGASDTRARGKVRRLPELHLSTRDPKTWQKERIVTKLAGFKRMTDHRSGIITDLEHAVHSSGVKQGKAKTTEELFHVLDTAANALKDKVAAVTVKTIWLHGCASLLAAAGVSWALALHAEEPKDYLPILIAISVLEFLLIGWAEVLHYLSHRGHHSEMWLNTRFGAELLRPAALLRPYVDPLKPLVSWQFPRWRRLIISANLMPDDTPNGQSDLKELRNDYLRERITKQIAHFEKQRDLAGPTESRFYRLMRGSALAALAVVGFVAIPCKFYELSHAEAHGGPWTVARGALLYFLPIALPLLAGVFSSLRIALDLGRRSVRYDHMISILRTAEPRVKTVSTHSSLDAIVREVEIALLQELNEFYFAQKFGLKH